MTLERIVAKDNKKRYTLLNEPETLGAENMWWIRANQGHSIEVPSIRAYGGNVVTTHTLTYRVSIST
jgi:RNA:NAD 2'-phosphotransferase (TPT1/KptA family)